MYILHIHFVKVIALPNKTLPVLVESNEVNIPLIIVFLSKRMIMPQGFQDLCCHQLVTYWQFPLIISIYNYITRFIWYLGGVSLKSNDINRSQYIPCLIQIPVPVLGSK